MVDALAPTSSNPGPMREAGVLVNLMQIMHGNRIVVGSFRDRLKYRDVSIAANGEAIFVLKLDAHGNPLSIRTFSLGEGITSGVLIMDKHENIYISGRIGPGVATDIGYTNVSDKNVAIVIKLSNDASGGLAVQWVREVMQISAEDDRFCDINAMTIDDSGYLYLLANAGTQYNTTRFPIPTFKMPTDSITNAKTEIQNIRNANATIPTTPINYRTGEYAELYANRTSPKELSRLYYTHPDKSVWAPNLYGMWFATAMLLDSGYDNDSLAKYNIEALCGNHSDMMKWVNTRRRYNQSVSDSLEKHDAPYRKTYCSTVTVGDSTYFTPINFTKLVICMDGSNGSIKWSNGFSAILEQYKYTNDQGGFYMRPVQWAVSGYLRDALHFDGSLFIVGHNDGYVADGKSYKALRPYTNKGKGELNMLANPGSDLMLMRMNAQTGRVEWAQTGGGRGGNDRYMKIARHDNYLFAIGVADPGNRAHSLNDGTGRNAAKDGVMLDSVVDMSPALITSYAAGKKLSSRFAVDMSSGMLFAKYNTEGRLLEKNFIPGGDVATDCELNGERGFVAMAAKIDAGERIEFNTDTVTLSDGGMGVFIYDMHGNPVKMLTLRDSMYSSSSMKLFIDDDDQLYVGGRSYSAEVVFNDTIHLKNEGYHDKAYYERPEYMAEYTPLSGRTSFYTYHGVHSGYLARASAGFSPAFTHVQHVRCHGNNSGQLTVTPYFSRGKCTYRWYRHDGADFVPYNPAVDTTATVKALPAGRYRVVVSDGHSTQTLEKEIVQPDPIVLTDTHTDVNKYCAPDGTINLSATGGTGSLFYFWSTQNGVLQPSEVYDAALTGLSVGQYDVTVTDANGCRASQSVSILNIYQPIALNPVVSHISSSSNNGSINLGATGGAGSLTFSWDGPGGYTSNASGASGLTLAGVYTATVTDSLGCTEQRQFVLGDERKLYATVEIADAKCKGSNDGRIKIMASGPGASGYQTAWTKDGEAITTALSMGSDGSYIVAPGQYAITLTDNSDNTNQFTVNVTISEPAELVVKDTIMKVTCNGYNDGQIILDVQGGTAPYKFAWEHPNTVNQATNQTVQNLGPAADYKVTVTDKNGCGKVLENMEVTEPKKISFQISPDAPISCYGQEDGAFSLDYSTIEGGNGGFWHIWSNTLMAPEIHGLRANDYGITIYDSLGCTGTWSTALGQPSAINIEIDNVDGGMVLPLCADANDGEIHTQISGGSSSGLYTYKWTSSVPLHVADNYPNLVGVPAGTYVLAVTDEKGCVMERAFTLTGQNSTPSVLAELSTNEICAGEQIQITAQGADLYDYYVDGVPMQQAIISDTIDFRPGEAKTYEVHVEGIDANQCRGRSIKLPLTVHHTPSVRIVSDTLNWCSGVPISTNLSAADSLQTLTSVEWHLGDSLLTQAYRHHADTVGVYTLRMFNGRCVGIDSVRVARLASDQVALSTPDTTEWCFGDGQLVAFSVSPAAEGYQWFRDGEPVLLGRDSLPHRGADLITNVPGEYMVSIVAGGNCVTKSAPIALRVYRPMLQLPIDTVFIAPGTTETLAIPSSGEGLTWRWNGQQGDSIVQLDARAAVIGEVLTYDVVITDTHGCHAGGRVLVKVGAATGVAQASLGRLTLYPSPTHSGFYVEPADTDRQLWLYSASGQLVQQQPLSGKTWVDTSRLPAGLYVVRTHSAVAKVVVE